MSKYFKAPATLAFVLFVLFQPLSAQTTTPQPSEASVAAARLFQDQKWAEAVTAYTNLTKTEPANGMAWYRLGSSLSNLNKYEEAVEPLKKAVEILRGPQAMYSLGAAYARLKDKDRAFEVLTQASTAGFAGLARLENDPNLANLRDDPRYTKLVEMVRNAAYPCLNSEKAKQFDFWVGEWDVQVNGQTVGLNVIEKQQQGCLIVENWKSNGGQSGKGINFFNPILGTWRQSYMSSNQTIWEMTGEYKEGAMRYTGHVYAPNGQTVMTRVTFFNLEPNRLRHTEDDSRDGGKTWTTTWDAIYIRRTNTQSTSQ